MAIAITLRIDAVERRLALFISETLVNKADIPLKMGAVKVKFPNKLSIDSILLKDQRSDTLLNIPHLSASFELIPLLKDGDIRINTLLLSEPDARVWRETADSEANFQFIIDRLASKDTTESAPLPNIRVSQVQIHDGRISYDVLSSPAKETFDASHLSISNLQVNASLRSLTPDTLALNLRRLTFDEKSGITLKRARAKINASPDAAQINNLRIQFSEGEITSDRLSLSFDTLGSNHRYSGTLKGTNITTKTFVPIVPQLTHLAETFKFDLVLNGTTRNAKIERLNLSTNENRLSLNMKGNLSLLPDNTPKYTINITPLSLSPEIAKSIYMAATDGKEIPTEITRLGHTTITVKIEGEGKQTNSQANIDCEAGNLNALIESTPTGSYKATLTATDMNIGQITDNPDWGFCGLSTTIDGEIKDTLQHTGTFNTTITPLQYKGYTYSPIRIQGNYTKESIETLLALNDSNLQVRMALEYAANAGTPRYELNMRIDSFSPNRLGLTDKHEASQFGFNIESKFFGNNIDNARLNLNIYDFTLTTPQEEHKIRKFHLTAGHYDNERDIIIDSDFINGSLKGHYSYKTLAASYKRALSRIMPSLYPATEQQPSNNNFVFHFNIKDTETLTKIFDLPVTIKNPSMLQGDCNDTYNTIGLSAMLNEVEYNGKEYRYVDLASNIDDHTAHNRLKIIQRPAHKESDEEQNTPENETTVDLQNQIHNDTIRTNIKWKNLYTPINNADVNIDLALDRNEQGELEFKAHLHKADITQNDTLWHLSPSTITGSNGCITIDNFTLSSKHQYAKINGKIGKTPADTLNATLRNVDLEYLFDMINFHPVDLGGEATGAITAQSLLEGVRFNSNLNVKGLTFEHGLIGNLAFNGYWDEEQKAIILKGDAREGDESRTIIDGFVSPQRDTLNICVDARETRIDFLNHLLSSFMSDVNGRVSGKLYILGAMRNVNMQGALAPIGSLRIKPTNTTYNLIGDTLLFTKDTIGFNNFHITDNKGNGGLINGGVHHKSLKRFSCSFDINANNLLAFNYPAFGEESFYGTAYVTGGAKLNVGPGGMELKADVTTCPGSRFVYNASTPEGNISDEFVTFVDRKHRNSLIYDINKFAETTISKKLKSGLNLDFMLDVTPDMQLRVYTNYATNDYIDVYGSGRVNAIYDEIAGFSMQGSLGLTRGTYKFTMQDIFPKEFDIRSGSNVKFDGDPFEAGLDLKTVYTLPSVPLTDLSIDAERRKNVKVDCHMDITGTIFKPSLKFGIELPDGNEEEKELLLSAINTPEQLNMQFIYLLGIGKFYTYDYNNQGNESQSTTAMESLISNTISGQLNNMLSQIIDNGNWNISGNFATGEKGWNSMEVEGMLSGRLLDNRLLINGNLGYRDNPMANKNFIGDFEVQWLLNKNGNISLKAYNKTNDRYFSKTTLTTQGAGILLKRDFDSWQFWKRQY